MSGQTSWAEEQHSRWTRGLERVYGEIFGDVDKELKRRDDESKKELKRRDEQYQLLSAQNAELLKKNAFLREENSMLRSEVENLDPGSIAPSVNQTERSNAPRQDLLAMTKRQEEAPATGSVLADDYRHITEKFNELNKMYQETAKRAKYLERKNAAVMRKNQEMKETVRAWQEYAERHPPKKQKLKSESKSTPEPPLLSTDKENEAHLALSSPRTSYVDPESRYPSPTNPSGAHPLLPQDLMLPLVAGPDESSSIIDVSTATAHACTTLSKSPSSTSGILGCRIKAEISDIPEPASTSEAPAVAGSNDSKTNSSQTTEDEPIAQNHNHHHPLHTHPTSEDDDYPQFVSARSLKRKRREPTDENHAGQATSDGTPTNPFRVKEEQCSSPPPLLVIQHLSRKETLDLDEIGQTIISTPHRRSRRSNPTILGRLYHQRSASVPLIKEEVTDHRNGPTISPNSAYQHIYRDPVEATSETNTSKGFVYQARHSSRPLQPLDPNLLPVERVDQALQNKRRKRDEDKQSAYQFLTESNEKPPPVGIARERLAPGTARAKFNQKLRDTDDIHPPAKNLAAASKLDIGGIPTPPSSSTRSVFGSSARLGSRKRQLIENNGGQQSAATSVSPDHRQARRPESRTSLRSAKKPVAPRQTPLRSKPASELKISDFKPNPSFNQGYSYAFAETVRKRGDRACLPGCTRPECCGSTFRTLAAAAASLTASQEEALLEDYLGDAYDSMRLTQMSSIEREELILQARTKSLSDKHGRHREAYERHTTPPGFWRVDFPTTQEQFDDRQKALELEKGMVQHRWAEAMRKGGKWIFRDE